MTRGEFAEAVFTYCARMGGSVTSWIRSPRHNVEVGGVPHSAHVAGLGADVVYDVLDALETRKEWASRLGLRLVVESDHDHVQPASWQPG